MIMICGGAFVMLLLAGDPPKLLYICDDSPTVAACTAKYRHRMRLDRRILAVMCYRRPALEA